MSGSRPVELQKLSVKSTQWLREAVRRQVDAFDCDFGQPATKLTNLISNLREILERNEPPSSSRCAQQCNSNYEDVDMNNNGLVRIQPDNYDFLNEFTRSVYGHGEPPTESTSDRATISYSSRNSMVGPILHPISIDIPFGQPDGGGCSTVKRSSNVHTLFTRDDDNLAMTDDDSIVDDHERRDDGRTVLVPLKLKRRMEEDQHFIKDHGKVSEVPVSPNLTIVDILEDYVKYFGLKSLLNWWDKLNNLNVKTETSTIQVMNSRTPDEVSSSRVMTRSSRHSLRRQSLVDENEDSVVPPAEFVNKHHQLALLSERVEAVKKDIDDLRILFDYLSEHCLLYDEEKSRVNELKSIQVQYTQRENSDYPGSINELIRRCTKEFLEEEISQAVVAFPERFIAPRTTRTSKFSNAIVQFTADSVGNVRKSLRTATPKPTTNNSNSLVAWTPPPPPPLEIVDVKKSAQAYVKNLLEWRLLPKSDYDLVPAHPTLIYGIEHLARMLVKLPQILNDMSLPDDTLKSKIKNINGLMRFVQRRLSS